MDTLVWFCYCIGYVYIYVLTVYQVLETHSDRLDLRCVFHGFCCCCLVFWYSWILSGYTKNGCLSPQASSCYQQITDIIRHHFSFLYVPIEALEAMAVKYRAESHVNLS